MKIEGLTRYSIEGYGTGYKVVEDRLGAWMQSAEVDTLCVLRPRCDTCRFWTDPHVTVGMCDEVIHRITPHDFGCVSWKKKE